MIAASDIAGALRALGVRRDDVLMVHSDVRQCLRVEGRDRAAKLETVCRGLEQAVEDGTLLLPTFTYSFCENRAYDPVHSPSTVGLLTEAFRRRPGIRRTADPMFSCAVRGPLAPPWEDRLMRPAATTDAFGPHSVFAYLLAADAKIACLGVEPTFATFVHHVEQRERVPYRYFKTFRGEVVERGRRRAAEARYYVRDLEADAENLFDPLVAVLRAEGVVRETRLDRGPSLSVVCAREHERVTARLLRADPEYLLERRHRIGVA